MPKTQNGFRVLRATVTAPGKVRSGRNGPYVGAKVRLASGPAAGEEVWLNAGDPDSHEGRALQQLGQGEEVQVTEAQKGTKTFYDLFTKGNPNQVNAFPEDDDQVEQEPPHQAPSNGRRNGAARQEPAPPNPLAESLARGVHQEMAQMRLITADVVNEMKKQGKENPDLIAALICAQAIWTVNETVRRVEELLWQHEIPSALQA